MKRLFIFQLTLMILHIFVNASHSGQYWAKTYGGESYDSANVIQKTSEGEYIVAGYTRSFSTDSDAWVLKIDSIGSVVWEKRFGDSDNDKVHIVQQSSDGNFIVLGESDAYQQGIWIQKLDHGGNILWQNAYGGLAAHSIQQTTDEGYILVGAYNYLNGLIIKLDSDGNVIWRKRYPGAIWTSVQQVVDGGYIVIGEGDDLEPPVRGDFYVAKLDQNGDISWQKKYVRSNNFSARSIQQTTNGDYIITGSIFTSYQPSDLFVLKMDSNGAILWQKIYDGGDDEMGGSIQQATDGGYIVAGWTMFSGTWLIKVDDDGNVLWQKTFDMLNVSHQHAIQRTTEDGFILVGSCGFGSDKSNICVLKLNSNGEIPNCEISETTEAIVTDVNSQERDSNISIYQDTMTLVEISFTAHDTSAELATACCYDDDDSDCDNILNENDNCPEVINPNQEDTDIDGIGDSCDYCPNDYENDIDNDTVCGDVDNCPYDHNANQEDNDEDGLGNSCDNCPNTFNLGQEDTSPPQGNGIGNACDCESDFDCDGDVDGSDATTFKLYFGRNPLLYPCDEINPCRGDFDCDGDCDGTDASLFKSDFGRSEFSNPCPACTVGDWCSY